MANVIPKRMMQKRGSTAQWNAHLDFIPLDGEIIIYTDFTQIEDPQGGVHNVPGIKIGDGMSYLIDLPFVTDGVSGAGGVTQHMANADIHTSLAEKSQWNQKISCEVHGTELKFVN